MLRAIGGGHSANLGTSSSTASGWRSRPRGKTKIFGARGPGRKYGTPVSGWQQQLVSRIGVPDHSMWTCESEGAKRARTAEDSLLPQHHSIFKMLASRLSRAGSLQSNSLSERRRGSASWPDRISSVASLTRTAPTPPATSDPVERRSRCQPSLVTQLLCRPAQQPAVACPARRRSPLPSIRVLTSPGSSGYDAPDLGT